MNIETVQGQKDEPFGAELAVPPGGEPREIIEEDQYRARLYGLISRVLAAPMSDETLEIVRGFANAGDGSAVWGALNTLGKIAVRTPRSNADDEYTRLFHGMGAGGEVQPYLSFYLTGFVYEKPLAALRTDLREIGIASTGVSKEPEDHMAFICEVMSGLIVGKFHEIASLSKQKRFFQRHLAPWATSFFKDLENAESAKLYKPIGLLGRIFMEVEAEAFSMVNE